MAVFRSNIGWVFGGYTSKAFTSKQDVVADSEAFLFSITKELKLPVQKSTEAISKDYWSIINWGKSGGLSF